MFFLLLYLRWKQSKTTWVYFKGFFESEIIISNLQFSDLHIDESYSLLQIRFFICKI